MKFKEFFFYFFLGWGVKHCWVALQEKFQFTKPKFELNIYLNQNGKATVFVKKITFWIWNCPSWRQWHMSGVSNYAEIQILQRWRGILNFSRRLFHTSSSKFASNMTKNIFGNFWLSFASWRQRHMSGVQNVFNQSIKI